MNQDARECVQKYLDDLYISTDVLRFGHYSTEEILDFSKKFEGKNLRELIILCINLAEDCCSINSQGTYETRSDSHRSCLDIWRHIKNYRDEFSIFDVMFEIYKMGIEGILVGHICSTINRRIFELFETHTSWELLSQDSNDEFGLVFEQWNNI